MNHQTDRHHHQPHATTYEDESALFEPAGWEERYSGEDAVWSPGPNPQLVAEVSPLTPGTALDVGCGEGGDLIWLAKRGWRVTGADFSAAGLRRAAAHASAAGVSDRTDFWQVDARRFDAAGRTFDLVTCHYLHPPAGGMVEVTRRLFEGVAPGGHLLVVGHAFDKDFSGLSPARRASMWQAADLVPALPADVELLAVEQRPRIVTRDGTTMQLHDSTLLARRRRVPADR